MSESEFSLRVIGLRQELKGFSRRFTTDTELASDLVQETIYRALKNREKFRIASNLKGWLFTIMRNIFINLQVRACRMQGWEDRYNDRFKEGYHLPDQQLEYLEIITCMRTIPGHFLRPFELFVNGYLYEEISTLLMIPLGTVKNRIFQCRQMLRQKLNEIQ